MKNQSNHYSKAVWLLIILQFLLGLGALIGGGSMVAAPDGSLMQMPLNMLKYSPFSNFLIPGIILFTMLGVYPLAVGLSLWQKPNWRWSDMVNPFKHIHWSWASSLASGIILLIWITTQVLMLRSIVFLHILYFVWGWVLILLTLLPGVRKQFSKVS